MKYLIRYILIAFLLVIAGFHLKAQTRFQVGGGASYVTDIFFADWGVDLRANAQLNKHWRFSTNYANFFSEKSTSDSFEKRKFWGINLDANYVFVLPSGVIRPYLLSGLNFSKITTQNSLIDFKDSRVEYGFNFGGGIDFNFKKLCPFIEGRYVLGDANQGCLFTTGLKVNLGKK